MQEQSLYANPFALMMNPQAVLTAIEQSERLNRLKSRVFRPLDGPVPTLLDQPSAHVGAGRDVVPALEILPA